MGIQGTVRKKYQSMRTIVKDTVVGAVDMDEDQAAFMRNLQAKTLEERSKERMNKRQEKLRRLSSGDENEEIMRRTLTKGRYLSMKAPKIIKYDSQESLSSNKTEIPQTLVSKWLFMMILNLLQKRLVNKPALRSPWRYSLMDHSAPHPAISTEQSMLC